MAKDLKRRIIKTVGYLPVLLCLGLFGWSYYAYFIVYCLKVLPAIYENFHLSTAFVVLYHVLLILSMWSYFMVIFVHPGTPSQAASTSKQDEGSSINHASAFEEGSTSQSTIIEPEHLQKIFHNNLPNSEDINPSTFHMITVKQNGDRRFCRKCDFEKPDRSHHCSVCGECILKMDHHCPWINNCVGFHNQKFFLLFIFYADLFCLLVFFTLLPGVLELFQQKTMVTIEEFQLVFLGLISGLFGLALTGFSGFHIYLLLNNRTTIENLERTVYKVDQGDSPTASRYLNIFDIGQRRNVEEVLGPKPYLWFVPIRTT